MKTLNDFKDEVAREKGFDNFDTEIIIYPQLINDLASERYAEYMAIEFAKNRIGVLADWLDKQLYSEYNLFLQNNNKKHLKR